MSQTFKQRFQVYFQWGIGLFVVMFLLRLGYGYVYKDTGGHDYSNDFFSSVNDLRKNYASEKFGGDKPSNHEGHMPMSQKYEKTANVKSKTSEFEKSAEKIKSETRGFEGVIQYEENSGNKGSRELHLMIGINPEKFDTFYNLIQQIGTIRSTEITKVDKTNEYRQLNAKKASLEKTLTSLNELKSKGGALADFVALHDKILEIEGKMQELGVELGNFDTENEFCTVRFSLYEGSDSRISLVYRIKVALEWTLQYYALMMLGLLAMSLTILILLLIINRLRMMAGAGDKVN